MKIFAMAASLRKDSLNKKLITQTVIILQSSEWGLPNNTSQLTIHHADFRDFSMPVYDGDIENSTGVPDGAKQLAARILQADALVIATPEYNGGIAGPLKNAIDWVSRVKPNSFSGKPLLLLGGSPGALGAVRGLWHSRVPLEALGALVFPEMFGLPHAGQAFTEAGMLADPKSKERLENLLKNFVAYVEKVRGS